MTQFDKSKREVVANIEFGGRDFSPKGSIDTPVGNFCCDSKF